MNTRNKIKLAMINIGCLLSFVAGFYFNIDQIKNPTSTDLIITVTTIAFTIFIVNIICSSLLGDYA